MANEDALKFNAVQNAVEKYDADGDGKLSGECGILIRPFARLQS